MTTSAALTFVPPLPVQSVCAQAVQTVTKLKRRGLEYSELLARHMSRGGAVDINTLKRICQVLDQGVDVKALANNLNEDGGPSSDYLSFQLFGGNAGRHWVKDELRKLERVTQMEAGISVEASTGHSSPLRMAGKIIKIDDALGIVFGWAIVSKIDGDPYFDVQGDHIPEDSMLGAAVDFMSNSRVLGDMHESDEGGTVLFAFPMTEDIGKAFGIVCKTTGLMIGVKPLHAATLEKFKDGTYTGFSIGGRRLEDEDATE